MSHHHTDYLTTAEVAGLLRVTPSAVRAWRWKGGGPPYVRVGNRALYARDALGAWLESRTFESTTEEGTNGGDGDGEDAPGRAPDLPDDK